MRKLTIPFLSDWGMVILLRQGNSKNIVQSGVKRKLTIKSGEIYFCKCFTKFDKERKNCTIVDELSYSLNQVQEMVWRGIQTEMAARCQAITNKNTNPNLPPTLPPPLQSANALTDTDLTKLANLLQSASPHTCLKPPGIYTEIVQG